MKFLIQVAASLFLFSGWTFAQKLTAPHVTVALVAESSSLQSGKSTLVGLQFQLEPGWHVYWTNPGDSGEPPKVNWQLPAGFKAGALQFPFPHRMPLQSLMNFGYEKAVLFPVEIQVPKTVKPGTAHLTANVRWMVCKDICIPGKGTLKLDIPVTTGIAKPTTEKARFQDALTRMPRKLDPGWRNHATLAGDRITLSLSRLLSPSQPPTSAEFFPSDDLVIENAAPQLLSLKPKVFELSLKKSDQMSKPPARLRGVVVVNGRHARIIDTPIISSPSK